MSFWQIFLCASCDLKNSLWNFPGSPVVNTLCFPAGSMDCSLVGELRSHLPHEAAKKKKTDLILIICGLLAVKFHVYLDNSICCVLSDCYC